MKLQKYNQLNQISRGCRTIPFFRIHEKGTMVLNQATADLLKVKSGDRINIYNDEERISDWYVEKTTDADGLLLRKHNKGIICNAVKITDKMFESLRITKKASFLIAKQPIEDGSSIYAILTSSKR